jgi:hypothetical protein
MSDDPWLALRHIRVTWDDGTTMDTSINGNRVAINRYYVGKEFNVGNGELDLMKTAVSVEFIDEETRRVVARWQTSGWDWINLESYVSDVHGLTYCYIGNGGGGGLPAHVKTDEDAIAWMDNPWGHKDGTGACTVLRSDRPSLKRVK